MVSVLIRNFHFIKYTILICFLTLSFIYQARAQVLTVNGTVKSARYPIKAASVTFISNSDTTKKYSALTDKTGKYEIGLPTPILINKNVPSDFQLAQNYPNPFSSSTAIPFDVNKPSDIKVTIYDILGREVRQYKIGIQSSGVHKILWDGRNNLGQKVANGIYLYKLEAGKDAQVRKMILNSGSQKIISSKKLNIPLKSISRLEKNSLTEDANNYTIRLENTDDTYPIIVSRQFENIQVNNDTTINFNVEYLPTARIDFDSLEQIIRGFGAANILLWRPDMTDSEIETAFGTGEDQLGFSILRLMVEGNSNRWNLYVPTAKKAYEMGAIIIASPWYAPDEMVETVNGVSRVRYDMYNEYAAHLDSFNTYMAENGVPIYGISVQNEPDITDQWTSWTSGEMFNFVKNNAHAISGTNVMAPESFQFRRNMSDPILNDSIACANTDIICGHIYGGGLASYPLAEQKGKEVWMTEYLINSGNPPSDLSIDTGWAGAMQTAKSINDCMNANMSAYVYWYIVRYYGPIADGTYAQKGEITKKGYVMSQFSRFIRPGYHRVYSSVYPLATNIYVSAYRDSISSKEILVAINTGSASKEVAFAIQNKSSDLFIPYTTTGDTNVSEGEIVRFDGNNFILNLEASSITTFISI